MKTAVSRSVLIAAALTLAVAAPGCGSDDGKSATKATTTTAVAAAGSCPAGTKYPPAPTIDQLNGLLRKGLDPKVPAADKVGLVQGSEADPALFDRMTAALTQADLSVQINDVTDHCDGTATADAVLVLNGQRNPGQVPLIADQGTWKLDKSWACGIVTTLGQNSVICS
ncbi:hypothetical protein ACWDSJ_34035 [Nocardia sp. NPDC003482]